MSSYNGKLIYIYYGWNILLLSSFSDEIKATVCDDNDKKIDDVNILSLLDITKIENLSLQNLMEYQHSITLPVSFVRCLFNPISDGL